MCANGFPEPPADTVAYDGVADLLGHCEADARGAVVAAIQNFKQEKPPAAFFTTADGQKRRPLAQADHMGSLAGGRQRWSSSGGEALAATIAASGDNSATTLGGHTGTETMPALADEFGRLIGTLHLF